MTPTALNDHGDIVGTMALTQPGGNDLPFLYRGGTIYDLTSLSKTLIGAMPVDINRFGQIVLNASDGVHLATPLTPVVYPARITYVVNAASWLPGPVAPGQFVTLGGSGLGPATGVTGAQKGLGGSHVFFDGVEAYVAYASDSQINAIAPYGITTRTTIIVQYDGKTSDSFLVQVIESSPGLFTTQYGGGPAVAVNNGGDFNSTANPVARGEVVSLWGTGQGAVSPAGQDGETISGWKTLKLSPKVSIGGVDAQLQFIGLTYTGIIQVNAWVPGNAPAGDNVEVILTIGNSSSRKGVTISVK